MLFLLNSAGEAAAHFRDKFFSALTLRVGMLWGYGHGKGFMSTFFPQLNIDYLFYFMFYQRK